MDSTSRSHLHVSIYKYFEGMFENLKSQNHDDKALECQVVLDALKTLLPEVTRNMAVVQKHDKDSQNELGDLEIRFIEHPMLEQRVAYLEFQEQKKKKSQSATTLKNHHHKEHIFPQEDIVVDGISELLDQRSEKCGHVQGSNESCDECKSGHKSSSSETSEKKGNAKERAKRKAIEMKKSQQEAKRKRELEYYKSVDVHELVSAPPHAREFTGTEWMCTARQRYQQYRCKGGKCKSSTRVRTYCSCLPTRWLCQHCFITHIRAEIV